MDFSTNHNIKVGDIISSYGEQVAIADSYEIWEHAQDDIRRGSFKTMGEATIRILSGCENVICTNMMNVRGVVCFLPKEFKGCAILKVKITRVYNKSVEAIPVDYIKSDKAIDWYCYGKEADWLLNKSASLSFPLSFPNIKRIKVYPNTK